MKIDANILARELGRISARVFHNSRTVPGNLKFKLELMAVAYGIRNVREDFEKWCEENSSNPPTYPFVEYVKVVDSRLGREEEKKKANPDDERVVELRTFAYDLTGVLPPTKSMLNLLGNFSLEEIKSALQNFSDRLTFEDMKSGMRSFWSEGGATAVILTERKHQG